MSTCAACGDEYDETGGCEGSGVLCPACLDSACARFRAQLDTGVPWTPILPGSVPVLLASYRQARQETDHLRSVLDSVGLVLPELGAGLDEAGDPLVLLGRIPLPVARHLARLLENHPPEENTQQAA